MRFPKKFTRTKGSGTVLLGSDSLPSNKGGFGSLDNLYQPKSIGRTGAVLERIVVHSLYTGSSTVPVGLPIAAFVFDDQLGFWIACPGSATTLVPSTSASSPPAATAPVYFDALTLIDRPDTLDNLSVPDSGAGAYLIIVGDPGSGAPNGTYDFVIGGEISRKSF